MSFNAKIITSSKLVNLLEQATGHKVSDDAILELIQAKHLTPLLELPITMLGDKNRIVAPMTTSREERSTVEKIKAKENESKITHELKDYYSQYLPAPYSLSQSYIFKLPLDSLSIGAQLATEFFIGENDQHLAIKEFTPSSYKPLFYSTSNLHHPLKIKLHINELIHKDEEVFNVTNHLQVSVLRLKVVFDRAQVDKLLSKYLPAKSVKKNNSEITQQRANYIKSWFRRKGRNIEEPQKDKIEELWRELNLDQNERDPDSDMLFRKLSHDPMRKAFRLAGIKFEHGRKPIKTKK